MKDFVRRILGGLVAGLLVWRSRPYDFPPGLTLVLAPHADDETLGCGGLIACKCARGDQVEVVFISDSAGSPEGEPVAGLALLRQGEALAALALLGVAPAHTHFLAAPDGRLNRLGPAESARLHETLVALLSRLRPAEVLVPYFGGGSTEHDATVQLAQTALRSAGLSAQLLEFPVWAWWNPTRLAGQLLRPAQNLRLDLGPTRRLKIAALACHASQIQPALTGRPALPPVLATLCTGAREFYFNRAL